MGQTKIESGGWRVELICSHSLELFPPGFTSDYGICCMVCEEVVDET